MFRVTSEDNSAIVLLKGAIDCDAMDPDLDRAYSVWVSSLFQLKNDLFLSYSYSNEAFLQVHVFHIAVTRRRKKLGAWLMLTSVVICAPSKKIWDIVSCVGMFLSGYLLIWV